MPAKIAALVQDPHYIGDIARHPVEQHVRADIVPAVAWADVVARPAKLRRRTDRLSAATISR